MATKIVTKNSSTGGSAPSASDLVQGELAVNVTDGRLYTENASAAIVELGVNPTAEIQANAGVAFPTTQKAEFRDSAIYINSSADGQLDIVADTEIQIAATTIDVNGNADVSGTLAVTGAFTSTGIDDNATSTAITIDASENVALAGAISIAGGIGELSAPSANDLAIYGTASGHTGIRFHDVGILPTNNAGAITDADCDIGIGTHRFKDLYLSGGVVFGPASASNVSSQTLDSYEEGTWTPSLNAGTFSAISAQYTKVGRVVTLTVAGTVGTGGGSTISNAPFTAGNTVATGIYTSAQNFNTGKTAPTIIIGGGSTTMYFRDIGDSVTYQGMALTSGASVSFSFTYIEA